jgi:manganese efflux pump family protein
VTRWTVKAAASAGLLGAVLLAGCSTGAPSSQATADACYVFGVRAIQRHITVTAIPPACAGLSRQQINLAVVRAVREVVGPETKPTARRLATEDSRYLADLVRPVGAPRPAPPVAVPPVKSSNLPVNLAALIAWIVTAAAGSALLAGWPQGAGLRRRGNQPASVPRAVIGGHVGLAVAGLATWIAYVATAVPALAWVAVGIIVAVAGLGMATLITAVPEPGASSTSSRRAPVFLIAAHGMLATATILLVVLAAVSAS